MARLTREQRRARRRADGDRAAAGAPPRPPRRPTENGGGQPPSRPPEPRSVPGGGARRFVSESWAELKKVEWPRQNQLVQGVVVVLVACIVVGLYLYGNDLIWKRFVQHVLLR
jgi:preprotein translocase SecE subunit